MDKTKYNSLCDAVIGKTFGDLTVTHISKLYAENLIDNETEMAFDVYFKKPDGSITMIPVFMKKLAWYEHISFKKDRAFIDNEPFISNNIKYDHLLFKFPNTAIKTQDIKLKDGKPQGPKTWSQLYYERNKERILARVHEYRKNNLDKIKLRQKDYRSRKRS